jgi:hypothetical protein
MSILMTAIAIQASFTLGLGGYERMDHELRKTWLEPQNFVRTYFASALNMRMISQPVGDEDDSQTED